MARIPGNPEGTGFGSFLSGAGQGLTEQIGSLGSSVFKYKLQHDFEMDRLNTQLEAREKEYARNQESQMFETVVKHGGLEALSRYLEHGQNNQEIDAGTREKYAKLSDVIKVPLNQQKEIAKLSEDMRTGDLAERIIAHQNMLKLRDTVTDTNQLKMLDYRLGNSKVPQSILANELLDISGRYMSEADLASYRSMALDYPGIMVKTLTHRMEDERGRLVLLTNVLESNNRAMLVSMLGPEAITELEKERERLLTQRVKDPAPGTAPDPELETKTKTKELTLREQAGLEFLKDFPPFLERTAESGREPQLSDVEIFFNNPVHEQYLPEIERIMEELSVGEKKDTSLTKDIINLAKKGLSPLAGGENRNKKLDGFTGNKQFTVSGKPGSRLKFRYRKQDDTYMVQDARRATFAIYPEEVPISNEDFLELTGKLSQL